MTTNVLNFYKITEKDCDKVTVINAQQEKELLNAYAHTHIYGTVHPVHTNLHTKAGPAKSETCFSQLASRYLILLNCYIRY